MPKIIENVRGQLLAEARRQVAQHGYADTTIHSVAGACGLGVGTVYNYFKSKEMLIATFVYEEWVKYLEEMASLPNDSPRVLLGGIFDCLRRFAAENAKLFTDTEAAKLIASGFSSRHKILREQIASFIIPLCERNSLDAPAFSAEFLAEALIGWSMNGVEFDVVYPILEKIIKS